MTGRDETSPTAPTSLAPFLTLRIADIAFQISTDQPPGDIGVEANYTDFQADVQAEVSIVARYDGLPEIPLQDCESVFESSGLWTLFRRGDEYVFILRSPVYGSEPYRIAVVKDDFRRATIHTRPGLKRPTEDGRLLPPLEYPLSELLMIGLLSRGRGLMTHSCGIDDAGNGYLFAGNSTHGKTTLSRIWRNEAVVLNDDRIVLRRRDGQVWMYGTPWHGEYSGISPRGLAVKKIFILKHAAANGVRRIEGAEAVSMIMARSFLPFWDAEGMRFSLDFCAGIAAEVPCCELGFVPDGRIVDFVRAVV